MKPLVEATVADQTGIMKATFFNQPWLERRYRPGTRLMLQGKYQGRNRFRVQFHAETSEQVGADGDVATYPATDGLSTTQIAALVREHRGALADVVEPLPARLRAAGRWPDRAAALGAAHFGDQEAGRLRLAFEELLLLQLALLRRRAGGARRRGPRRSPRRHADRALAGRVAPFTPTDDQARAMAAIDSDLAAGRPMQRLLMGEVGSGKTVVALLRDAARGRARRPGGAHGADGDARRAALRDAADAHAGRAAAGGAADRVDARRLAGPTCSASSRAASSAAGRHARADRGRGDVRPPRRVAVVDEQHRFGVNQRRALDRKAPEGSRRTCCT